MAYLTFVFLVFLVSIEAEAQSRQPLQASHGLTLVSVGVYCILPLNHQHHVPRSLNQTLHPQKSLYLEFFNIYQYKVDLGLCAENVVDEVNPNQKLLELAAGALNREGLHGRDIGCSSVLRLNNQLLFHLNIRCSELIDVSDVLEIV